MKKTISVLLSLLIVVSSITCTLVSLTSTASAVQPVLSFDQAGESLIKNLPDEWQSGSQNCQDRTKYTVSTDSKLGGSAMERTGDAMHQGYYVPVNLDAGRTYSLQFYIKTTVQLYQMLVLKDATYIQENGWADGNYSVVAVPVADAKDSDGWVRYSANFAPIQSGEHHIYFHFGYPSDTSNNFIVSDFTLIPQNVLIKAETEGNGAVFAVKGNNSVTFTANPYMESEFLGWYEGDTLKSTEKTYTYTYTALKDYTITAKFSDNNLLADYTYKDWMHWDVSSKSHASNTLNSSNYYLGGNATEIYAPSYQYRYVLVELGGNSTYDFEMYVDKIPGQSIVVENWRIFRLSEANTDVADTSMFCPKGNNTFYVSNRVGPNNTILTVNEPTKLSVSFTTTQTDTYVIGVKFGACVGNCTFTDWSLINNTKYTASVTSTGNGAAKVSEVVSGKCTFTATPYSSSEFLGWYNGDALVSNELVYNCSLSANITLTAKFSGENLLDSKNIANVKQASETENNTGKTIYSAVTDTEGWWSNGHPRGQYKVSSDSHLGGTAITNPSMGYQAHVYTMLLKPNTKYSVEFSVKCSNYVRRLWLLTNEAVFGYTSTENGKGTGGKWNSASGSHAKDWINDTDTDLSQWKRYSHTFVTNDSDEELIPYYLYADFNTGASITDAYTAGIYFSDLSLLNLTTIDVTVNATGNGAAKVETTGTTANLIATSYASGGEFLGWYDKNGNLASKDKEFELQGTANSGEYTAKFTKINLAKELNNKDTWQNNSWATVNNANEFSKYGGGAISFSNTIQHQGTYLPLNLKPNTQYSFSFSYKVTGALLHELSILAPDAVFGGKDKGGMNVSGGSVHKFVTNGKEYYGQELTEFVDFSATFTTSASENKTDTYYFYVKHLDQTSGVKEAIISDLSLVEVDGADLTDFAQFKGNAIRSTGTQALRFKYDMAADLYSAGYFGYEVKEIGALAIRTEYLGGASLKISGNYIYNSENKMVGQAIVPEEALGNNPTIALTNIGVTKDKTGNDSVTDYSLYGTSFTVRPYIILNINGVDTTLYGEETAASVFAVMQEIEQQYNSTTPTEGQLYEDYISVSAVLAIVTDADSGTMVKNYYDAWKEN